MLSKSNHRNITPPPTTATNFTESDQSMNNISKCNHKFKIQIKWLHVLQPHNHIQSKRSSFQNNLHKKNSLIPLKQRHPLLETKTHIPSSTNIVLSIFSFLLIKAFHQISISLNFKKFAI